MAKYVCVVKEYYATLEFLSKNIRVAWLEYATKYSLLLLLICSQYNIVAILGGLGLLSPCLKLC